jgi:hypothetical protein
MEVAEIFVDSNWGLSECGLSVDFVVVVFIFRPVEPKARLPKGIGRPAACMAYLS